MELTSYFSQLNPPFKQQFIDLNWQWLKTQTDLNHPTCREVLSLMENQFPSYKPGNIEVDFWLIENLANVGNDCQQLLFHFVDTETELKKTKESSEIAGFTYFYHDIDGLFKVLEYSSYTHCFNWLNSRLKSQLPHIELPFLETAKDLLNQAFENPRQFSEFVDFWSENKRFILTDNIDSWTSPIPEVNQIIEVWKTKWDLHNSQSEKAQLAKKSLTVEQNQIIEKIAQFFIQHPEIYHQTAAENFPPPFIFMSKLSGVVAKDMYLSLERVHLEIIIASSHNMSYESFFTEFTGLHSMFFRTFPQAIEKNQMYLTELFSKNLPFNELLAKTVLVPADSYQGQADYFENYFKAQTKSHPQFAPLVRILHKTRLDLSLPEKKRQKNPLKKI